MTRNKYLWLNRVSVKWIRTLIVLTALSVHTLIGQTLSIVVEAGGSSSRDSHFNWGFQSSGGGEVQMGQFACGSYWVAPAEGDSGVTVLSLTGNPEWNDLVSCDADPIPERMGLLDGSNRYGNYDAAENIIPNLPISYTPAWDSCISLVAAMQRNEAETSKGGTKAIEGEVVDAYCVVTLLPSAPENGGGDLIRPNITGATKELLKWEDFDLTRLPAYSFIGGYDAQGWEKVRVKWSHSTESIGGLEAETGANTWKIFSEGGRAFRAHNLINDYGAGMTQSFNNDLLALFSDENTLDEKKGALAAMLSFGLDIYHARYDYGTGARKAWLSGAGQHGGKFLPCVLLAALSLDEGKGQELRKVVINNQSGDRALGGPQELRQIARGQTGVLLWGDFLPVNVDREGMNEGDWRYWADFKDSACYDGSVGTCSPGQGKKTAADPYGYHDGPGNKPGGSYMPVSFGGIRGLAAAMVLMPEIRAIVNTDAPIEYADRLTRHGIWSAPDPVAVPSTNDQTNGCTTWWSAKNCEDWGITWGSDPSDIRYAIEDGKGRFTSLHGKTAATSYESSRAQDNWVTIISLYDGEVFEDNAVGLGVVVKPEIFIETGDSPKGYLRCPTLDAEIRYTLDGSEPTEASALYLGPIMLNDGDEIRAKGYYPGKTPSEVRVQKFGTDTEVPSIPENLVKGTVGLTGVELSWDESSDNFEVSGYYIYVNGVYQLALSGSNVIVDGLNPSTDYTFTVSAYDRSGNESSPSDAIVVRTLADEIPPSKPVRLAASTITATTVKLVWNAAGDNVGVWGYRVYVNGANTVEVTETTATITGLSSETAYTFSVSSIDTSGNESELSSNVQGTTGVGTGLITWMGYTADSNGEINTGDWIGWVKVTVNRWGWSYAMNSWIYATGDGPGEAGAWVYVRN